MAADVRTAAQDTYEEQVRISVAAQRAAESVWAGLDPYRLTSSWTSDQIGASLYLVTSRAQELAASAAEAATAYLLAEQDIEAAADAVVVPRALAGVASDGRDLASLLLQPLITANAARVAGATPVEAKRAGLTRVTRIVGTQTTDAGRAATGLGIATRRRVGYVRLVNPGACGRCVVLAGRFYRWSSGFLRHPLCHCRNIPAAEDTADDVRTDPAAYFQSLTTAQQDLAFTRAGAQAIRDGSDISRVVNARRGALGLTVPGQLATTTEATTARALGPQLRGAPRLMPEAIYQIASDRDDAVRLLRRNGYVV